MSKPLAIFKSPQPNSNVVRIPNTVREFFENYPSINPTLMIQIVSELALGFQIMRDPSTMRAKMIVDAEGKEQIAQRPVNPETQLKAALAVIQMTMSIVPPAPPPSNADPVLQTSEFNTAQLSDGDLEELIRVAEKIKSLPGILP